MTALTLSHRQQGYLPYLEVRPQTFCKRPRLGDSYTQLAAQAKLKPFSCAIIQMALSRKDRRTKIQPVYNTFAEMEGTTEMSPFALLKMIASESPHVTVL